MVTAFIDQGLDEKKCVVSTFATGGIVHMVGGALMVFIGTSYQDWEILVTGTILCKHFL